MKNAPILIIGIVTSEKQIPRPPNTTAMWESVIVAEAILKGEVPDEPLRIPYIGFLGADCSGGPRLQEGERVMVPLYWGGVSYAPGEEAWQLHGIFSKVLFEDGQATLEWWSGSAPLGTRDDVIRLYGENAGADESRIEAAIDAANVPPSSVPSPATNASNESNGRDWPPIWTAGAVVLLTLVLLIGLRSWRRRFRDTSHQSDT